jgi:hypothetical protein
MPSQSITSNTISIGNPYIPSQSLRNPGLAERIAKTIYEKKRNQPQPSNKDISSGISVVCVSDTHNTKPSLPHGDILLHAGDLSQYGLFDEIQQQLHWLNSQPHHHKFVIAGNHDLVLDQDFVKSHPDRELNLPGKTRADLQWGNVIYLEHQMVSVTVRNQHVRIFGSPWTPRCGNFAFQYELHTDFWKDNLPEDLDILLVHGPPLLHLDGEGKGCPHLLTQLWRIQPKLVVYGHIHEGRGEETVVFDKIQFLMEEIRRGQDVWKSLLQMMAHTLKSFREPKIGRHCVLKYVHFVNAAVVSGPGYRDRWEAVVVNITGESK